MTQKIIQHWDSCLFTTGNCHLGKVRKNERRHLFHFQLPQNIISCCGCQLICRLNLCPVKVFSAHVVCTGKSLQISFTCSLSHTHTEKHQSPAGTPPSVTQSPLNSTPHCSDLLPPKLQLFECCLKCRGRSPPYSVLSFLITTALGQVRSHGWYDLLLLPVAKTHMYTCSHKHLQWGRRDTHWKAPEVVFLSNYNLSKNVENSLLDKVVFRSESLVEIAGLQGDGGV